MILVAIFGFLIGLLSELVNTIEDDNLKRFRSFSLALGMACGVVIAYSIVLYPMIAPLALGNIIGLIVTKKIDAPGHYVTIGSMIFLLSYYGIPQQSLVLLGAFTLGSAIDELGDDFCAKNKVRGIWRVVGWRLMVEIMAISVSLVTSYWQLFIYIFSYDFTAYVLVENGLFRFLYKTK